MDISSLIGKRALITDKKMYNSSNVVEIKFIELSPSSNWVKLQDIFGKKYWKPIVEISLVEVLKDITNKGKPE